ncbi:MAG: hypothetical protein K2O67_06050 [Clostridia bacterium]|nr:hypothetical protein [Clostridia bacterium]
MKVAVIGHRQVKISNELNEMIYTLTEALIKKGADSFCFSFLGAFSNACYKAATALKQKYPINRVYYYSHENALAQLSKDRFDVEVIANKSCCYKSINTFMIDDCDVLLTLYDEHYVSFRSQTGKSGTYFAVKYANKRDKRIVNIIDFI